MTVDKLFILSSFKRHAYLLSDSVDRSLEFKIEFVPHSHLTHCFSNMRFFFICYRLVANDYVLTSVSILPWNKHSRIEVFRTVNPYLMPL